MFIKQGYYQNSEHMFSCLILSAGSTDHFKRATFLTLCLSVKDNELVPIQHISALLEHSKHLSYLPIHKSTISLLFLPNIHTPTGAECQRGRS